LRAKRKEEAYEIDQARVYEVAAHHYSDMAQYYDALHHRHIFETGEDRAYFSSYNV